MAEDILSQEEVDALLRGVTGELEDIVEDSTASAVRPYDLGRQERIVRGRMPTLEIINERFVRLFRIGLFNFMRRNAEISVGPVRVMKYSEFLRNLVVPTNLNLVHMKPLRGTALFIFDPNLVFLIVDNLFGGDGRFHTRVEGRDFTPTEQRIIHRLLDVTFAEYKKSWEPVYPITFEYMRSEMHTQFINIATPTEVVVTATFNIELGTGGGDFHICMPYAMIEPIKDLLSSSLQADRMEIDHRWLKLLKYQVQNAEVELITNLIRIPVTLGKILSFKEGDVIPLTDDLPQKLVGDVDGVPIVECKWGIKNNRRALKVHRIVAGSDDFFPMGDD